MSERELEPAAPSATPRSAGDEPPPVLGSWPVLYALVVAGLLAMIALCWAVTRWGGARA